MIARNSYFSQLQVYFKQYTSKNASPNVSPLDVIVPLTKTTLVSIETAVLVETVIFVMVNVSNLFKNQLITRNVKFIAGKAKKFVIVQAEKKRK